LPYPEATIGRPKAWCLLALLWDEKYASGAGGLQGAFRCENPKRVISGDTSLASCLDHAWAEGTEKQIEDMILLVAGHCSVSGCN